MRSYLLAGVCLASCGACFAQDRSAEELFKQSDPAVQAQLRELYEVRNVLELRYKALDLMQSVGSAGEVALVRQLAIDTATDPSNTEEETHLRWIILGAFALEPAPVIEALAPYLGSENERLRGFCQDCFRACDAERDDPFREYAKYLNRAFKPGEEVPKGFIEYLYSRSPERALLAFNRASAYPDVVNQMMEMRAKHEADLRDRIAAGEEVVVFDESAIQNSPEGKPFEPSYKKVPLAESIAEAKARWGAEAFAAQPLPAGVPRLDAAQRKQNGRARKEIMLAEHIVSNAIWLKQHRYETQFQEALPEAHYTLRELAKSDHWWVRLYVAHVMRRHPPLRLPVAVDELSRDSNELVRKAVQPLAE